MAAANINAKDCQATTFCVTGGTGFVGSWLVKSLLERGYNVHATVRDPGSNLVLSFKKLFPSFLKLRNTTLGERTENEAKVRHLLDIPGAAERLKLFKAELLEEDSFNAAVSGCHGVFHVASPTRSTSKDPENDLIKPAVEGTLSVLKACTKAQTVKRVVVTSSAVTFGDNGSAEQNQSIDESFWPDVDSIRIENPSHSAYVVSKNLAERAALQYGKKHHLDVVTIIPVLVAGPSITPNVPFSMESALSLLTGIPQHLQLLKLLAVFLRCLPLIHVDDLCSAHIFLMENPSAEGRYICSSINTSIPHLAQHLSKRYPQYNVPTQFEDVPDTHKVNISSKKLVESGFSFKFGIDEIYDDAVVYLKTKGLLN